MISCSEAVERLWDYLENEVAEVERAAVEEHLAFCRRCCGEVAFAEELRAVLASAAEIELPPAIERRLTSALDELDDRRPEATSTDHGGTR
ncbi:MAG: zf-HC2 domain-containing protein [Nitriliruptor sp.]|nr:MAG: zf-HC2 domain-containing protein [Nitriliruptor sp.]